MMSSVVIPSKRPRPREDSVTGSPGQMQGMLPPSRSETPQQQNFSGMPQAGAMPQQTPGQFPHLQANGSANATPSPIMGNQMRPGSVPQRVATASPHPFSPGPQQQQQFASQASPAPSEHGTPQPNQFMQNAPQGFNPAFAPSPSNPRPSPNPNAMGANQMMQQHMAQMPQGMNQMQANMYAQMQQQGQGQGQHAQQRQGAQGMQGMTEQQKMAAYQMRLQQQLQGNMQMQAQMQAQGMGRGMMQKPQLGVMPNGQMPQGGMRPQQRPMAGTPEQFMKNLAHFMASKGLPFDPNPAVADRPVNIMLLFQAVTSKGGFKMVTGTNGWPHIAGALGLPAQIPTVPAALKQVYERNLSKFEEAWIAQQKTRGMGQTSNMPNQGTPQKQMQPGSMHVAHQESRPAAPATEVRAPPMMQKSDDYSPCVRELATFGGVDLHAANILGSELERWMPTAPTINELGNIDIAALTRSLQCGMHSEVRLALDTLATLSNSPNQAHLLHLRYCDDLVDALIDCAEEQVDLLVEHTVEVADEISLTSYEDVVRACRIDRLAVRDCPAYGTVEYDLDRAVDKLICVTTILRNASFPGEQVENHLVLADEMVIKFLCSVIRYLGTRTMLLRSHTNTLDFMKDVVILLSNIATSIELPSREEAICLLNFLLAFAPSPAPTTVAGSLFFAPYEPSVQPYLPHAVDSLAKLLARDEPNRGFYKAIFGLDSGNNSSHDILTRTFALAISPLPNKSTESARQPNYPSLIDVRKPFLMQGLLAAEILASLAPGFESGIAKSWLLSGEGLAQNLTLLVRELGHVFERPPPRGPRGKDNELLYIVVVAVSLLRRLAEKARDPNQPSLSLPKSVLPSARVLMEALSYTSAEWTRDGMLQQLWSIVNMAR
ncbi:SWI/SNF chromatin-remodeling complex subunit sol1 [Beauveria bassiana]|nr:SWI/SNF chromatin-remodeling complex subunit sol1 [Beauveria bassiana]